jgi:hypothetical protein
MSEIYLNNVSSLSYIFKQFVNVAVSDARCTLTNGLEILKQINCREYGRKRSWRNAGNYTDSKTLCNISLPTKVLIVHLQTEGRSSVA